MFALVAAFSPNSQSFWASTGLSQGAAAGISLVSGLAYMTAGFGVLKGYAWGRTLYLAFGALGIVVQIVLSGSAMYSAIFGIASYAVFALLLLRKPASQYFAGTYEVSPDQQQRRLALATYKAQGRSQSDIQRVFAILFAGGGGAVLGMGIFTYGFASGRVALVLVWILAIPGLGAIALGTLLWGRKRWAELSGWTFLVVGACAATLGAYMVVMMQTEAWNAAMTQTGMELESELAPDGFGRVAAIGAFVGLAGAVLLQYQRKADGEEVTTGGQKTEPND